MLVVAEMMGQFAIEAGSPLKLLLEGASPVGINGPLKVCGNFLCNQHGKPIQLRGMSTHGLQWYGWGK